MIRLRWPQNILWAWVNHCLWHLGDPNFDSYPHWEFIGISDPNIHLETWCCLIGTTIGMGSPILKSLDLAKDWGNTSSISKDRRVLLEAVRTILSRRFTQGFYHGIWKGSCSIDILNLDKECPSPNPHGLEASICFKNTVPKCPWMRSFKGFFQSPQFSFKSHGTQDLVSRNCLGAFFCVSILICINTKFLRPGRFSYSSFVFRSFLLVKSTRKALQPCRFLGLSSRFTRSLCAWTLPDRFGALGGRDSSTFLATADCGFNLKVKHGKTEYIEYMNISSATMSLSVTLRNHSGVIADPWWIFTELSARYHLAKCSSKYDPDHVLTFGPNHMQPCQFFCLGSVVWPFMLIP